MTLNRRLATRWTGLAAQHTQTLHLLRKYAQVIIFVALIVVFSLSSENFTSTNNILLILMHAAPLGIVVAGQTLVIITGGIDLSVGSVAGLTSIVAAKLMLAGNTITLPPFLAISVALMVAAAIGWMQGWLITHRHLSPFIVTFSTLSLVKGLALVYSRAAPIPVPHGEFAWLWRIGSSARPVPVLLMFLVFAGLWYILRNTKLGRYAYAIGSNETVARMSGVNVARYKTYVYVFSSLLAGIAGILLMSRIETGAYTNGESYPLISIAAVVIGGASLRGGSGSAWGSLLGVLMLIMVDTGLGILNVSPLWSTAVVGALILLAALADAERRKAQETTPPPIRTEQPADGDSYLMHLYADLRRTIKQHFACEHVRLYLADRETGELIKQGTSLDDRTIISRSQHIAKQVEQTRTAIWLNDLHQEDSLRVDALHEDLKSVIAVPILRGNRLAGILELQSPYGNVFNEATAARLQELTRQIAVPLEDAWLLDSGWFLRHTREAFRHLWDEIVLGRSALAGWLFATAIPGEEVHPATRGQELQQILLNTIDAVRTKEGDQTRSKRYYDVLYLTYVEDLPVEVIIERLSISRRQYFYSLKDALAAAVHCIMSYDGHA